MFNNKTVYFGAGKKVESKIGQSVSQTLGMDLG